MAGEEDFLVCYADNLTDIDLDGLIAFHRQRRGLVTMAVIEVENTRGYGIAELDEQGLVLLVRGKAEPARSPYSPTQVSMSCAEKCITVFQSRCRLTSRSICCHGVRVECSDGSGGGC